MQPSPRMKIISLKGMYAPRVLIYIINNILIYI